MKMSKIIRIVGLLMVLWAVTVQAQYTILHEFTGNTGDGAGPWYSTLTPIGTNLYGMTTGGFATNGNWGGVLFQIQADGSGYTNLHTFASTVDDGRTPYGSLTLVGTNLYGMTYAGGTNNGVGGVIFQIQTDGSGYTNLHSFAGGAGDGWAPYGNLTLAADGTTLYGMTWQGGASGNGVIFRIQADGSGYTNLHEFAGGTDDGQEPRGSLTLSTDGTTLYGTTEWGGVSNVGVIFQIYTDGSGYTNLYSFGSSTNSGGNPNSDLTLSGTNLYGTAQGGGAYGEGVIFKIHTDGSGYTNLHNFAGGAGDGGEPLGSLMLSGATLYGMTFGGGGISNNGVVFALSIAPRIYAQDPAGVCTLYSLNNQGLWQPSGTLGDLWIWRMIATGHVLGNGQADIFWETPYNWMAAWWSTTNGTYRGEGLGNLGSWELRAVADVDGDGIPDLLFQNATGDTVVWYMNSDGTISDTELLAQPGMWWQLKAAADINGDGQADLFWQSPDGWVVTWLSTESGYTGAAIGNLGSWELRAAIDMDSDGVPDLLWQNADGWTALWYMTTNCTLRATQATGNIGPTNEIIAAE